VKLSPSREAFKSRNVGERRRFLRVRRAHKGGLQTEQMRKQHHRRCRVKPSGDGVVGLGVRSGYDDGGRTGKKKEGEVPVINQRQEFLPMK